MITYFENEYHVNCYTEIELIRVNKKCQLYQEMCNANSVILYVDSVNKREAKYIFKKVE